jgi:ABC-type dipeptide/oligopeptide/nickel transport system ATPase component
MVTVIKKPLISLQAISQPRFMELVGPAGSGKSTLARALCQRSAEITMGPEIAFRNADQIPIFIGSIPLILSTLFSRARDGRSWTWDEIKFLIYLKKWNRVLALQALNHPGTILLDHGPIFKLATLHAFGPNWLRSAVAEVWWSELFQQWATLLDLIVWLDAPDRLLETRINARDQKHEVKGKTGQDVIWFLDRYRTSYQYVLSGLAAFGGPSIIKFDTSQATMEQTVEKLLDVCRRETIGI